MSKSCEWFFTRKEWTEVFEWTPRNDLH